MNMNNNIILASSSPQRRELMKLITEDFEVIPANVDETLPEDILPEESAEYLARLKCSAVALSHPESIVIGSDTTVLIDKEIFGKPRDKADAERMLKKLSGRRHLVITGAAMAYKGDLESFSEITEVEFYPLTDKETEDYINTGEPFGRAGAYGIQGKGGLLVKGIRGDFNNVVGFPVSRLKRELDKFVKNVCTKL